MPNTARHYAAFFRSASENSALVKSRVSAFRDR
ncbi:hypothetical protein BH11ACT6_BH11ACT6_43970 [soil metagenome]